MKSLHAAFGALFFLVCLVSLSLANGLSAFSAPTVQFPPSTEAFNEVWTRTDLPVQLTLVQRSFYWGSTFDLPIEERYDEGDSGKRLVQYFEKSRMEINNPGADRSNPFYVTNGQLAKELITGRVQVGNANFVDLAPAQVAIASDTSDTGPNTPTYASFGSVVGPNPQQLGETVRSTINRAGETGQDEAFSSYDVQYTYYEPATENNIPDVFWDFLNASGIVFINGQQTTARLSDPYFYATGYPISPAYWAKVTIAGVPDTAVLIQAYERRVLTYVPSAPEGWQVQMGNVGLHYYEWRYGGTRDCTAPSGKTGALWFDRPDVQQGLGCAGQYSIERGVTAAHQQFERGEMIDIINTHGPRPIKSIYVIFEDGTAQFFWDTFEDGAQEPEITPPAGLYVPHGGFGKVWREANLGERLGWATAPETVASYDPNSEPVVPSPVPTAMPGLPTPEPASPVPTPDPPSTRGYPAYRAFGGRNTDDSSNMILYTGPDMGKLYVIYASGKRWTVFNDTYQP